MNAGIAIIAVFQPRVIKISLTGSPMVFDSPRSPPMASWNHRNGRSQMLVSRL